MRGTQLKTRAVKSFEAPFAAKSSFCLRIQLAGVKSVSVDQESAASCVCCRREIHSGAGFAFDVKNKIVRDVGGEHQRSAFDGQNQRRFLQAEYFFGIYGAKRRELSGFDGGQSDDDDGLRFAKRRRIIETQIQLLLLRQRERGNVLIFRGVEIAENASHVDDGSHVGAVKSSAHE